MGILHVEDQKPKDFKEFLSDVNSLDISEKIDGVNACFGLDENGELFTSRFSKSNTNKIYDCKQYPFLPKYNSLRAAHTILKKCEHLIKQVLTPGDVVDIEIMFGRQPNAIIYGDNRIVFLRMIEGNPIKIDQLGKLFDNIIISSEVTYTHSNNGINLINTTSKSIWFLDNVPTHTLSFDINPQYLDQLNYMLNTIVKTDYFGETTKQSIIESKLNTVPHRYRPEIKQKREKYTNEFNLLKQNIKNELLKTIRQLQPAFQTAPISISEDIGIEGIVVRNKNGNQTKIVDREKFTAINEFNHAVRNQLIRSEKSEDFKLLSNSNIIGFHNQRINNMLNESNNKYINKQTKNKIRNEINSLDSKLNAYLQEFKKSWCNYSFTLNEEIQISYNKEIYNRTLSFFAATRFDKIINAHEILYKTDQIDKIKQFLCKS